VIFASAGEMTKIVIRDAKPLWKAGFALAALTVMQEPVLADEGGVSFWLPGQYASLVAVPSQPGWSLGLVYYHASVDAGRGLDFPQGGEIRAGLESDVNLLFVAPSYTFEEAVLGGRATLGLTGVFGRNETSAEATLSGPGGGTISGDRTDMLTSVGDLYPTFSLKWNAGVSNYMTYITGDIPVGDYEAGRLANIGIGHAAIDGGAGYTYFNPVTGREISILGGLTYNFENPDTNYQNGVDGHIDWAAAQFLSPQVHVGIAGYVYQQLTGDSGQGTVLGDFKSRVLGIGPQVGFMFPTGTMQGYLNIRGYYEFAAENRAEGWNALVTLALSPPAQAQ